MHFDGITQSARQWAADYGIPARLIRQRVADGWSVECAITTPMPTRPGEKLTKVQPRRSSEPSARTGLTYNAKVEHEGETLTLGQWATRLGFSRTTVPRRLAAGWSLDQALTTPIRSGSKRIKGYVAHKVYEHGGLALTVPQWSAHLNVHPATLRARLKRDWSYDRVFDGSPIVMGPTPAVYAFDGQTLTITEWSKRLGVSTDVLRYRLKHAYPLAEVFTAELFRGKKYHPWRRAKAPNATHH